MIATKTRFKKTKQVANDDLLLVTTLSNTHTYNPSEKMTFSNLIRLHSIQTQGMK